MSAVLLFLVCPVWAQYPSTGPKWNASAPVYAFSQTPGSGGGNWSQPYPNTYVGSGGPTYQGTLAGTVTITFTWDGGASNEPAPKNVVVTETMNPQASAGEGRTDTGLPGNASTRYEVKDSSSGTFSVTSPTMTAWGTTSYGMIRLSIDMSASPSNVTVSLTGTTMVNNTLKVLTGQQLTATLNAGGFPLVDAQGNITDKPTWSFATGGAICFGDFYLQEAKTYNSASEVPKALTELGAAPTTFPATFQANQVGGALAVNLDVPSLSFYTKDAGTVKVSAAATVKFPDNTTGSVSVVSGDVTSVKPSAVWVVDPLSVNFTSNQISMDANVFWHPLSITVPNPFSGGWGCLAQIVVPNHTATRTLSGTNPNAATTYVACQPKYGSPGTWEKVNGEKGLDGGFPYPIGYLLDTDGNVVTTIDTGFTWNIGDNAASGDKPGQNFQPPDVDNGGNLWTSASGSDNFTTWLMYKPSPNGSYEVTWVPLMINSWSWKGDGQKANGMWTAAGSVTPGTPGSAGGVFPKWSKLFSGVTLRPAP